MANVLLTKTDFSPISSLFQIVGQPVRLEILLTIGRREMCVCSIEAALGLRQSVISQHLMILRKAGLVRTSRVGRNIYYRLVYPDLLDLIIEAARLVDYPADDLETVMNRPITACPLPDFDPG